MTEPRTKRLPRGSAQGLAAALLVGAAVQAAGAEPTACPAPQRAVFSCSTGARVVAVCASPDLGADSGVLQYRYGRPARLELALPAAGTDWRALTRGGTLMFSGGGGAYLAFDRDTYRYTVYSAAGQGWAKSGVLVEKAGRRIASLRCKGGAVSELGPDLFTRAGVPAPDVDFELP